VAESPHDEKALEGLKSLLGLADDAEREQAEQHLKTFLETRQLSAEQLEVKVYNHLLNFFELY
jgi:adenine-specific DNA-methyltransferase